VGIDWTAETQVTVDGLIRDALSHPDPATRWDELVDARLLPVLVEPEITVALCVEAVGLAVLAVQVAAVMLQRDPVELLDQIQRFRGTPTGA
jgi:hypothetical protein